MYVTVRSARHPAPTVHCRLSGQEDIEKVVELIRRVSVNRTVLMVEHNLNVVANLSDTITVLTRGQILAEGDYASVSANKDVQQAYMGSGQG